MPATKTRTSPADVLTDLILEVFRLNGRLLAVGDVLTHDLGLSSARWQVIGAIALAKRSLPVAQIARNMGLSRQSVQRVADELNSDGFVTYADNPDHRRAKLVVFTPKGRSAYAELSRRQVAWAKRIVETTEASERGLCGAVIVLQAVRAAVATTEM